MTLAYVDTNVIIDAIEGRRNLSQKDISKPAADFFFDAISCKFRIVLSYWTLKELDKYLSAEKIRMALELIKKKVIYVQYDGKDVLAAKARSPGHFQDALHIILAEKSKADVIITRNDGDFKKIGTAIPIKKPEYL